MALTLPLVLAKIGVSTWYPDRSKSYVIGYGGWCDPMHVISEHWLGDSQINANVLPFACMMASSGRGWNKWGYTPFTIESGYTEYGHDLQITNASWNYHLSFYFSIFITQVTFLSSMVESDNVHVLLTFLFFVSNLKLSDLLQLAGEKFTLPMVCFGW